MGKQENGPFATLFMWIGIIAGGAAGVESGELLGMCIGALILGAIGFWVGRLADAVLFWVIFVASTVIAFLINSAIRRFVWELIQAAFA